MGKSSLHLTTSREFVSTADILPGQFLVWTGQSIISCEPQVTCSKYLGSDMSRVDGLAVLAAWRTTPQLLPEALQPTAAQPPLYPPVTSLWAPPSFTPYCLLPAPAAFHVQLSLLNPFHFLYFDKVLRVHSVCSTPGYMLTHNPFLRPTS